MSILLRLCLSVVCLSVFGIPDLCTTFKNQTNLFLTLPLSLIKTVDGEIKISEIIECHNCVAKGDNNKWK